MTTQRDIERVLDAWMDDGPTSIADRVIAAALDEITTTPQRGGRRLARRFFSMTALRPTLDRPQRRFAPLMAAAFLLLAVIGIVAVPQLLPADTGSGIGDGVTFTSERHGYDLTLPEGWTMNEIPGEWRYGTAAVPEFPGTDEFASPAGGPDVRLHIWVAEAPAGATLDAFIESYDLQVLSALECAAPLRQERILVAGRSARLTALTCSVGGADVRIRETLFVASGQAFVITMDAQPGEMTDAETDELYRDVLTTFRVAD